jgi:threonine/homoserine efflux transporter RhtA
VEFLLMSTSMLVSLLAAQVLGMSLFFTEAYPDAMVPLIQMALAAALASAVIFFCLDMVSRTVERLRRPKSRPYRRSTSS